MNNKKTLIAGLIFLSVSMLMIALIRINPPKENPAQSTESKHASILQATAKGFILTQEVTMTKDHLNGIDLVFTQAGRENRNQNTLLILDHEFNILEQVDFPSSGLKEGDYTHFGFDKPLYIGKGNTFLLSLYSADAQESNAALPLMNAVDSVGKFSAARLNTSDIPGSVRTPAAYFKGSLMFKTYESNSTQNWIAKSMLFLISLLAGMTMIFWDRIQSRLQRLPLRPEYLYLPAALAFAGIFAVVTPPFSVPDEGTHFKLSYNISEFGLFDSNRTYPASIGKIDSSFMFLNFLAGNKTTVDFVKGQFSVKTEPGKRYPVIATEYTLPYIPQSIGIFFGRVFSDHLMYSFYLGRFFNLILSALLIFFAIRIIPGPLKLLMLLLALMPKTVFLFGSLSYDAFTISLSFFSIALFLYYAYSHENQIGIKELLFMAGIVVLLLLLKPPYFLIGLLFFLIPPRKFGKIYWFLLAGIGVAVLVALFWKIIPITNDYLARIEPLPVVTSPLPVSADSASANTPLYQPDLQMKRITSDVPGYLELICKSGFSYYREYIVNSFVGVLGYIDVELPQGLTNAYLLLLLLIALTVAGKSVDVRIWHKAIFVLIFILAFIAIETAMYLYATRPGRDRVFGVQGRYFIPIAPLIFMILYNQWIHPWLRLLFSPRRKEYKMAKPKAKPALFNEIAASDNQYEKYLTLIVFIFSLFALFYSVYLSHLRFYLT
jgi:uncharacterized membrane protein